MALSSFGSGSQTATLTTEHTLSTVTNADLGQFQLTVDAALLVNGETLTLRAKTKTRSGDTSRILWEGVFVNALGAPAILSPIIPCSEEIIWTLRQDGGTGRAFPWNVLKLDPSVTQTGDAFARLGAPAGVSISADILVLDNFVDDIESRLGTPVGATFSADIAAVQADTDNLQTRIPAALIGGRMDSNMQVAGNDTFTAASAAADLTTEIVAGVFARAFGADYQSKTFAQLMEAIASGVIGPTAGAGTAAELFKTLDGVSTKVTVNNDGTNRTTTTVA